MRIEDIRRKAHNILDRCAVEDDFIEYEKSLKNKDSILKTVCAYANNYMNRDLGLIFIGVEEVNDQTSGEKVLPRRPIFGIKESLIESTENEIKSLVSHVHPQPRYHLIQDQIDNQTYIIIAVEPGNDGPYETDQKAENDPKINLKASRYIRVRRDTRKPNKREEFELLKKFTNFRFSSELNETATLNDLNYEYMKEYLVRSNSAKDLQNLNKLDMAKALNLIGDEENGEYRVKNFAVLMFADQPDKFIPYARVEIIREAKETDKMESVVFNGPIWIQAQQIKEYFRIYIMSSYVIRESGVSGARLIYNWPIEMFEELATNCILHKEYSIPQYIGIYVYRDHLIFINHNRPLPPITIHSLNDDKEFPQRNYINPEIKEMFFKLNLIQSYGSGIRRAKVAMDHNNSPKLVFSPNNEIDDYTKVVAYINEEFAKIRDEEDKDKNRPNREVYVKKSNGQKVQYFINDQNNKFSKDLKEKLLATLSPTEISKISPIIEYLQEKGYITPNRAQEITNKSSSTVRRYLKIMLDLGFIVVEGKTNNIVYKVNL